MTKMNAEEIINYIGNSKKATPVKVYLQGDVSAIDFPSEIKVF
jgi:Tetrahydrodipicolinate N-succinyltransferase